MATETIYYDQTETYESLVDEYEVFDTYYDALVFLAVVGYEEGEYVEEGYTGDDNSGEIKLSTVFGRDVYRTILASMAFQHTGEPAALVDRTLQSEIVAQYAAGGDRVLQQKVKSYATDPTDDIVSYVRSARENERKTDKGILGEIIQSFDDEIVGISD
jgi:dnd system-associated protein 4